MVVITQYKYLWGSAMTEQDISYTHAKTNEKIESAIACFLRQKEAQQNREGECR